MALYVIIYTEDKDRTGAKRWDLLKVKFSYLTRTAMQQAGQGWDGSGCFMFTLEVTILLYVYQGVDIVIQKAIFFFLIAL